MTKRSASGGGNPKGWVGKGGGGATVYQECSSGFSIKLGIVNPWGQTMDPGAYTGWELGRGGGGWGGVREPNWGIWGAATEGW
jgi:hypothetical protein